MNQQHPYWGIRCKNCLRTSDFGAQVFKDEAIPLEFLSKVATLAPLVLEFMKSKAADAAGITYGTYWWAGQPLEAYFFGHALYCDKPEWELINTNGEARPLVPETAWMGFHYWFHGGRKRS